MTAEEIQKMMSRKHAAQSALKFFTAIKKVESPNLGSSPIFHDFKACMTVNYYRAMCDNKWIVTESAANGARTGVGCCCEKMSICYTSLASNPRLIGNSSVIMCSTGDFEHAYIVVTDLDIGGKNIFYMRQLSITTMVVDGWTEDWYFPNLSGYDTFMNNLVNIPNATQYRIRNETKGRELKRNNPLVFLPEKKD